MLLNLIQLFTRNVNKNLALVALSVTGAFLVAKYNKYCSLVATMYNTY